MGKIGLKYIAVFVFLFVVNQMKAQTPVKQFTEASFDSVYYSKFSSNKKFPDNIKKQVLIALSYYPELKDIAITFQFREKVTPLTSRPRIFSIFKGKGKRKYIITISSNSKKTINPILFSNLPFNAQIGVLGHELGHISEYIKMNSFQLMAIPFKMISRKYTNRFEFNTDLACINHGLGYQLHDWSAFVRKALKIPEWKGATDLSTNEDDFFNQRYMNPATIEGYMDKNNLYTGHSPVSVNATN